MSNVRAARSFNLLVEIISSSDSYIYSISFWTLLLLSTTNPFDACQIFLAVYLKYHIPVSEISANVSALMYFDLVMC
jgi:hypothetical protein